MTSCEAIQQLMDLLEPLEAEIVALASDHKQEKLQPLPEAVPTSGTSSKLSVE
jgi:hypothetical protein